VLPATYASKLRSRPRPRAFERTIVQEVLPRASLPIQERFPMDDEPSPFRTTRLAHGLHPPFGTKPETGPVPEAPKAAWRNRRIEEYSWTKPFAVVQILEWSASNQEPRAGVAPMHYLFSYRDRIRQAGAPVVPPFCRVLGSFASPQAAKFYVTHLIEHWRRKQRRGRGAQVHNPEEQWHSVHHGSNVDACDGIEAQLTDDPADAASLSTAPYFFQKSGSASQGALHASKRHLDVPKDTPADGEEAPDSSKTFCSLLICDAEGPRERLRLADSGGHLLAVIFLEFLQRRFTQIRTNALGHVHREATEHTGSSFSLSLPSAADAAYDGADDTAYHGADDAAFDGADDAAYDGADDAAYDGADDFEGHPFFTDFPRWPHQGPQTYCYVVLRVPEPAANPTSLSEDVAVRWPCIEQVSECFHSRQRTDQAAEQVRNWLDHTDKDGTRLLCVLPVGQFTCMAVRPLRELTGLRYTIGAKPAPEQHAASVPRTSMPELKERVLIIRAFQPHAGHQRASQLPLRSMGGRDDGEGEDLRGFLSEQSRRRSAKRGNAGFDCLLGITPENRVVENLRRSLLLRESEPSRLGAHAA